VKFVHCNTLYMQWNNCIIFNWNPIDGTTQRWKQCMRYPIRTSFFFSIISVLYRSVSEKSPTSIFPSSLFFWLPASPFPSSWFLLIRGWTVLFWIKTWSRSLILETFQGVCKGKERHSVYQHYFKTYSHLHTWHVNGDAIPVYFRRWHLFSSFGIGQVKWGVQQGTVKW
jgi:hypothetical protein